MTQDTQAPQAPDEDIRHEILDIEKFPNYVVRDKRSILQLIRNLENKRALLSVYVNPSVSFVSAVLAVTPGEDELILDASPDQALKERSLGADRLTCVTRLEGIRVQFTVAHPGAFPYDGMEALKCTMPEAVLRLQRRECYRLPVPVSHPVLCRISRPQPDGTVKTQEFRALDISNGGLALVASPGEIEVSAGMLLEQCVLALPEFEPAPVKLKVRNQFHVETRAGVRNLRFGCEFVDLPSKLAANIQRYIFKVERDRRALQTSG
ncbi:MAG: flagellar brake protein [Rhodocyclaceae bacterium]